MSTVSEVQGTIEGVVELVGPAVVGLGRGWHPGSGVVIASGSVLTTAHNVRGGEVAVSFADGSRRIATLAATDEDADLAVLAVDTGDVRPVESSRITASGDGAPGIGAPVVALADPGGRGLRATLGFVSASGRSFRGARGRSIRGCIEHTAPLPRGSSGGPLVDPAGRLIALNAIRLEGGLILAVPADATARRRVDALVRGEAHSPVRLGIAVAPAHVARRMRRAVGLPEQDGVLVRSVEEGGAAARAGVERGDLIVSAAGRPAEGVDTLYELLDATLPGGTLQLGVLRGADRRDVQVSFDAGPKKGREGKEVTA
jgi:serine protease Do